MKRLFRITLFLIPAVLLSQAPRGSISGRILTSNGEPAVGVRVSALELPQSTAKASSAMSLASLTQTDATGRYRLEDVPSGRYLIMTGLFDAPAYYPGVFLVENAASVNVPGGSVTGIDFKVPVLPVVSGRIRHAGSLTPAQAPIVLQGSNSALQLTANPDGSFRFNAVRPGTYSLSALSGGLTQPSSLQVGEQGIAGLEVTFLELVNISTSIAVEGGGPMPRFTLLFTRLPDGQCKATGNSASISTPGCSQAVTLAPGMARTLAEGDYQVAPVSVLPRGYFVKSIAVGDVDLLKQPYSVKPGVTNPIVITLGAATPAPGVTVRGRMRDEARTLSGAGPVKVWLVPAPGVFPPPLAAFTEAPVADVRADGSFEFPMVPPGAYVTSLGSLPAAAVPITVMDKDVNGIDVVIPRAKEVAGQGPVLTYEFTNPEFAGAISVTSVAQCDGSFRVLFPTGTFSVTVTSDGKPANSATYGGANMLTRPITIAPGDREELRVAISQTNVAVAPAGSVRVNCRNRSVLEQQAPAIPSLTVQAPPPVRFSPGVQQPLTWTADVAAANCLSCPAPSIPTLAMAAKVNDTVTLVVIVGGDGRVYDVGVVRGHQLLRDAAVNAVRNWVFRPLTVNGAPFEVQATVDVKFR